MKSILKKGHLLLDSEKYTGYLFILPNFILFAIFFVFPFVSVWAYSLTDWDLFATRNFVGFSNYVRAFLEDDLFLKVLWNTIYYSFVAVLSAVFLAFWLALLMNRKILGRLSFRLIYFFPYVSLMAAVAIVWRWLYHPDAGLINYLLGLFGIKGANWLNNEFWAMPAIIVMANWKGIGFPILIFLAAFQEIPNQLYESARLDGASWWDQIRHITFPLATPAIFFAIVISLIGALQLFDPFYIMTQGGPAYATTTASYYIYQNGFIWFKMGYASTLACILFILILMITFAQWRLRKRWVYEG